MATVGLNISGGEFNGTGGSPDNGYHYPTLSELQYYNSKGVDFVRIPVGWERLQPALGGPLDLASDIAALKQVLTDAASLGMNVVLDLHNYGRYNGLAIGAAGGPTAAQFADFWQKMATEFKGYPALVGYDLMNEPHDMPAAGVWKAAAQAATDAIRTVDMKAVIYVEGDGWSSTHTWLDNNADLIITDPANRLIYTAHGYYDHWNEGAYRYTYDGEGAYPNIGVDRLKPFVDWLNAHGFKGMVGEFGIPSDDPRWQVVQKNALDYMVANGLEATAWGGGPWDPNYTLFTAKAGQPDSAYMNLLEGYFNRYSDPFAASAPTTGTTLAVNDLSVNEQDGFLTFTVTRAGDLALASSVDYATANGSALAGSDYTAAAGTLSFAAGQATVTVRVAITNDTLVENPETFTINLSNAVNATISDAQGVGTIVSEDVPSGVVVPAGFPTTPTIVGTSGNDNINADWTKVDNIDAGLGDDFITGVGSADFINGGAGIDTVSYHWSGARVDVDLQRTYQQNGDANGDVLVNIENVNGSGYGDTLRGDDGANVLNGMGGADVLTGRGGADTFVFNSAADANGDVITDYSGEDRLDFSAFAPKFLSLTNNGVNTIIAGDTNNDGVADFTVTLNGVFTVVNGVTLGTPTTAAPSVTINDVMANEQAGTITFTVTRTGVLTGASTVNFSTANGTATAGSDYSALSGIVSFAAGEATRAVTVALINDTLVEPNETFTVNLSGGTNVTIADAQGVGTIVSDDVAPTPVAPSVVVGDVTANEANGLLTFTLTRSGDLTGASTVSYATANGTATAGSDYTGASGTVSFAAGQSTATVNVALVNDTLVEANETLFLNLSGGTNLTIADAQGVGTIVSDDVAPTPVAPSVVVGDVTANEAGGVMTFVLTRSGDLTAASSVSYTTGNGTAVAGSDYTAASGTVSFAAGQSSATVNVALINDTLVEANETLTLNLSGGTNLTIADAQGVGTIVSDDVAIPPTTTVPAGFPTTPTITGSAGNDYINADWSKVDNIDAGAGDDFIVGVGSADYVNGGAGLDTIDYHWSGARVDVDLTRSSQLYGDAHGDVLVGIENVNGSGYGDVLRGDDGANVINGLGGADTLTGRGGADTFVFGSAADAKGDVITDFAAGVDKLDFRGMDANAGAAGVQSFTWLDSGAFTGVAGQLREYDLNGQHFVAGDTNGDGVADFAIQIVGSTNLSAADLYL